MKKTPFFAHFWYNFASKHRKFSGAMSPVHGLALTERERDRDTEKDADREGEKGHANVHTGAPVWLSSLSGAIGRAVNMQTKSDRPKDKTDAV